MLQQSSVAPATGFSPSSKRSNCVARALFDNIAETQDEIAFRKGELLTVLEQNTSGLEGWWLCCLRGRQGIAPGNRLRLLPGVYDHTGLGFAGGPASSGSLNGSSRSLATQPSTPSAMYPANSEMNFSNSNTPTQNRRRSWHANPNKVVMPQRIGDVYLYDVPVNARLVANDEVDSGHSKNQNMNSSYDVPHNSIAGNYDVPHSPRLVKLSSGTTYDHPRSHSFPMMTYDTPRSIPNHDYDVPPSEMSEYDVPVTPKPTLQLGNSKMMDNSTYDVPLSHQIVTSSDNYVVPASQLILKKLRKDFHGNMSNRSSGVSFVSTVSSPSLSPACSQSSLNASLSLSSLGGSNRSSLEQQPQDLYDIPPSEPRKVPDGTRNSPIKLIHSPYVSDETYDVPTNNSPANLTSLVYDTPPMPRLAKKTRNLTDEVYDVPPQVTRDVSPEKMVAEEQDDRRHSSSSSDSRNSKEFVVNGKELPIDLEAAMEILVNVQQDVAGSIGKLFGFVTSNRWRERQNVEDKMYDIERTCHKLKSSVIEFLRFAQGALANSTHAADKSLSRKLSKLIAPLVDSDKIIESAVKSLDDRGWQIIKLDSEDAGTPDELDQLVACSRGLVEDVRQVASFIQGNSPLIFKRAKRLNELNGDGGKPPIAPKPNDLHAKLANLVLSPEKDGNKTLQDRPLPPVPLVSDKIDDSKKFDSPPVTEDGPNDYDYVNLEPKEAVEKEREEIKASLPKELKKSFENVVKQSEIPVEEAKTLPPVDHKVTRTTLDAADVQLLRFYTCQVETHVRFLSDAIETFFATVKNNQPPKVFIGHSKFVVISAHKLVFIGDTIQRNARHPEVKNLMSRSANALCEALKSLVNSTKNAALQFPSVEAVQVMVDSVVDVSHLANDLKLKIIQATCL